MTNPISDGNAGMSELKRKQSAASSDHDNIARRNEQWPAMKKSKTSANMEPTAGSSTEDFPFLRLPPELRNRIYELALTTRRGLYLVSKTRHYRRIVVRGVIFDSKRLESGSSKQSAITTALLRANKQVNAEAISCLYGQGIFVEDHNVLMDFLAVVGTANTKRLRDLHICTSYGGGPSSASLLMLAGATGLRSLSFDHHLMFGTRDIEEPKKMAQWLWRALHLWIGAYGRVAGRVDAAIEVIKLDEANFKASSGKEGDAEAKKADFDQELQRLVDQSL